MWQTMMRIHLSFLILFHLSVLPLPGSTSVRSYILSAKESFKGNMKLVLQCFMWDASDIWNFQVTHFVEHGEGV
jgi:hypothetical protein